MPLSVCLKPLIAEGSPKVNFELSYINKTIFPHWKEDQTLYLLSLRHYLLLESLSSLFRNPLIGKINFFVQSKIWKEATAEGSPKVNIKSFYSVPKVICSCWKETIPFKIVHFVQFLKNKVWAPWLQGICKSTLEALVDFVYRGEITLNRDNVQVTHDLYISCSCPFMIW